MTRKQKQQQERAEANVESLDQSSPAMEVTKGKTEADTLFMDAARATTPSTIGNEEPHDVVITVSDNSCSITTASEPVSTTSSEKQPSPELAYPPSDGMDVDTDISLTSGVPNSTCETTSKPSSGIPVGQFYASMPKPGDVKPVVVVDNEDSGEDQQQEAEVDDMLAVTQSSSGDLLPQYVVLQEAEISILIDICSSSRQDLHLYARFPWYSTSPSHQSPQTISYVGGEG